MPQQILEVTDNLNAGRIKLNANFTELYAAGGISTITRETPTGAVNGVNVTYTLSQTPTAFLHVYLNGLLLDQGGSNDYTISGAVITMTSAPLTGAKIRASYMY